MLTKQYIFMSFDQNAGENHNKKIANKISNTCFKNVLKFKHLRILKSKLCGYINSEIIKCRGMTATILFRILPSRLMSKA
jgi:hypothetical protein